jgi:polyisoprenoid-binding protein YceI
MRLVLTAGLLLLAAPLTAQGAVVNGRVSEGRLSFDGHASTGDFVGVTTEVSGAVMAAEALADVTGWVEAPVRTLKTANDHRDRDLNKSMESEKYPTMRFDLASVTPGTGTPDSLPATLHGRLLIHGVTGDVDLPAVLSFGPASVRVRTDFPLNLKDYRIGGLSKMLGILRMHEKIEVHVDVTFRQASEPT